MHKSIEVKQYLVKAKGHPDICVRNRPLLLVPSTKLGERATRHGLGPPSGVSIGRLSGVGALWDCVPRVCGGGGGCTGGGVPLVAVPMLSWCGEVSLGGKQSSASALNTETSWCCVQWLGLTSESAVWVAASTPPPSI